MKFDQPGYEAEWRAVGKQMVDHFREKKWTHTHFDMFLNHKQRYRFFPWDCEEVKYLHDNDLQRRFRKLWEGTFDRKSTKPVKFDYTLGTTWVYANDIHSDLSEFIDVYIAGTGGPAENRERQIERQIGVASGLDEVVPVRRVAEHVAQGQRRDRPGKEPLPESSSTFSHSGAG